MGCVSSRSDINDQHSNIFQVTNINEQMMPTSLGKLQVTDTELVFHQKRGKGPTKWPLRSLRKYGFDDNVFTFECGRRCPTGEGVYAFRCRKAEQLFNIVQQYLSGNGNSDDLINQLPNNFNTNEFPIPAVSTGPPVQRRTTNLPEGYVNPVPATIRLHPALSRPGSITSNGPSSPTATSPPPLEFNLEHNNNKRGSLVANLPLLEHDSPANYMNITSTPLYMNIDNTKDPPETLDPAPCYANIDHKTVENLRPIFLTNNDRYPPSVPQTPTSGDSTNTATNTFDNLPIREVNYVELDLDSSSKKNKPQQSQPVEIVPERQGYTSIDFDKTTALLQSINPTNQDVEEGSRKTRHNSTIHYNNSLSD